MWSAGCNWLFRLTYAEFAGDKTVKATVHATEGVRVNDEVRYASRLFGLLRNSSATFSCHAPASKPGT